MSLINRFQEKNHLKWNTYTFAGILLIVICGIHVTSGLENYMDVLFWDESLYLTRGVNMFHSIPKDWGPSYSLWYKFLSFFLSDKVDLYYFNFKLTTILISIMLFLFLLSCGVQRVLAFIFSVFFISTFINMPLWPRVSHYCIIVLLTGIIIAKYQKTLLSKFIIVSFALLVCAYARPELFLTFLLCWIISYLIFIIKIRRVSKTEISLIILLTAMSVFMYVFFKTPLNGGDANRGIGVFLQHFAMNYSLWNQDNSIFWLDFQNIIKQNFTDSVSLKEIIQSNPALFKQHIISNISNYVTQTAKIIFSFFAPIFTKDLHWLCLMVSIILFIVYFSFTNTSKKKRLRFYSLIKDNFFTIFIAFVFAMPPLFVCIYAYPREHYLILQVPVLLLFISLIISSISVEIEKPVQKITVIGVICFFVMPVSEDFVYFDMFRKEESLCNQKTIEYIKQNFTTKDSVRIFDIEGGLTNMLPANFTNYNHYYLKDRQTITLSSFLLSNKFDIIYHTPTLTMLKNVQKDTTLFDILNKPEKYGYFSQKTGNFTPALLIKKK